MEQNDLYNLSPPPAGIAPPKNDLEHFRIQVQGDLNFARQTIEVYSRSVIRTPKGIDVTLVDLNFHIKLLSLLVVSLVAASEGFIAKVCRRALLHQHNLFGQFDSSISWKDIPASGQVDPIWEALADQALANLESGKLRTFTNVLKKLGVNLPSNGSAKGKVLAELIARRNVIVHSANKPDKAYLSVIKSPQTYPSGGLVIDINYMEQMCNILVDTGEDVIRQLVKKGALGSSEM